MLTAVQSIVEVMISPEVQGDVRDAIDYFNDRRHLCTQDDIDVLTRFMELAKWVSEHWNMHILYQNVNDFMHLFYSRHRIIYDFL